MPQKPQTTPRPDLERSMTQILTAGTDEYIAPIVSPALPVDKKGDTHGVLDAAALLTMGDDRRAPRTNANRGDYELGTDAYNCVERTWEEPVDDTEADEFSDAFDLEEVAAQRVTSVIMRGHEYRVAHQLFNETKFTPHEADTDWDDLDGADPLADVNAGKIAMRIIPPNALIIGYQTYLNLGQTDAVIDRIKYVDQSVKRGEVNVAQLAAYFGVDRVLVGRAVYNSAAKGNAAVTGNIWSDTYALLCRIGAGVNKNRLEPCVARTYLWTKRTNQLMKAEQYREERAKSTIIRGETFLDEKLMCDKDLAGYLLKIITG